MAKGETYDQFVDKFKPKLTTDDCYTPAAVYDAVAGWVAKEYKLDQSDFVRPFWPGGDYESYDYPEGCVVVDNPPFSILSKIVRFYDSRKIRFFLWAPSLTLFCLRSAGDFAFLPVSVSVTYANGAVVSTSFVSNLEPGCVRTSSELSDAIRMADSIGKPPRCLSMCTTNTSYLLRIATRSPETALICTYRPVSMNSFAGLTCRRTLGNLSMAVDLFCQTQPLSILLKRGTRLRIIGLKLSGNVLSIKVFLLILAIGKRKLFEGFLSDVCF